MSHYVKIKTAITDRDCLLKGLKRMGFKDNQIETHDEATNLYGYQGDKREDKANVIIRRKNVGASSNDIGFTREEDGSYRAIISEYDQGRYNDKWVNELNMYYGVEKAKTTFEENGWSWTESETQNKEIQLVGQCY